MKPPTTQERLSEALRRRQVNTRETLIHVTALCNPPWMMRLYDKHYENITPLFGVKALLGIGMHNLIEDTLQQRSMRKEARFQCPSGESWKIIGTPDYIRAGVIRDYKTTSVWHYLKNGSVPKREWEVQLNLYRWLACQSPKRPYEELYRWDELQVECFFTDWSYEGYKKKPSEYPPAESLVFPVYCWHDDDVEEYLSKWFAAFEAPEPCTSQERWTRDEHWAVMKPARKTSVRNFTDQDRALDYIEGMGLSNAYVEYRPGVEVRCERYCDVAEFCSWWRERKDAD